MELYMFAVTFGVLILILSYVFMSKVLNFRTKTTNRYTRVIALGMIASYTGSTFLVVITYIYGFYAVFAGILSYVMGGFGNFLTVKNIMIGLLSYFGTKKLLSKVDKGTVDNLVNKAKSFTK